MLRFIIESGVISAALTDISIHTMLRFIDRDWCVKNPMRISIHTMLRFIPRKYKHPLLRDIYILAHKSAFFNTFYQPFFIFFCHNTLYSKIITYISRFPTFLIYIRLVKIRTITNTLIL